MEWVPGDWWKTVIPNFRFILLCFQPLILGLAAESTMAHREHFFHCPFRCFCWYGQQHRRQPSPRQNRMERRYIAARSPRWSVPLFWIEQNPWRFTHLEITVKFPSSKPPSSLLFWQWQFWKCLQWGQPVLLRFCKRELPFTCKLRDVFSQGKPGLFLISGDQEGQCRAQGNLGASYFSKGNYKEALTHHRFQLVLAMRLKDAHTAACALSSLGHVYTAIGDYPNALASHKQCVLLVKQQKEKIREAREIGNVGAVYLAMGDFDSALECHNEHLKMAKQLKDRHEEARAYSNLGSAHHYKRTFDEAIKFHNQVGCTPALLVIPQPFIRCTVTGRNPRPQWSYLIACQATRSTSFPQTRVAPHCLKPRKKLEVRGLKIRHQ